MKTYGCLKEIKDKRDYKFKVDKNVKLTILPDTYKITMPKVKNQR